MQKEIEKVLDLYVRPRLLEHEGGVQVTEYQNHILKVRLTGRCSGCPSASLTTEEMIKEIVQEHLPGVQDVILVTGVSDDLITQARSVWQQRKKSKSVF